MVYVLYDLDLLLDFHCVTSSVHKVELRKLAHGVTMSIILCCRTRGIMSGTLGNETEAQRMEREAKEKEEAEGAARD